MHSHGIVHLDIKPENILIKQRNPWIFKLCDFGQCSKIDGTESFQEGDSRYCSMEVMNDQKCFLPQSDIFSFGVTLYKLITSK